VCTEFNNIGTVRNSVALSSNTVAMEIKHCASELDMSPSRIYRCAYLQLKGKNWFSLSSYKAFHSAVNNINVFMSSFKRSDIFSYLTRFEYS
jgi:hypothetical protein